MAALSAASVILAYGVLVAAAKPLLSLPTKLEQAELIVVLGGDATVRAVEGAALYNAGLAPRVLVTGDGDCLDNRAVLLRAGVPDTAIVVECQSRNTMQNSQFSAAIMAAGKVRRALIVTSWYHSRRALGCFRKAAPGVELFAVSAARDDSILSHMLSIDGYRALAEYLKVPWYALHYGVIP